MTEWVSRHAFSHEIELLRLCATTIVDAARAARIRAVASKPHDWGALPHVASEHGVAPLVYRTLSLACPDVLPPSVQHQLRQCVLANATRVARVEQELVSLLRRFAEREIAAVPLKGPVLAAALYGASSLRQAGDLDLLIDKEDVPAAKAMLLSLGYRPAVNLTPGQERAYLRWHYAYPFVRGGGVGSSCVELHWTIGWTYSIGRIDVAALRTRAETTDIYGLEVPVLGSADQLLYLCVHGSKHLWNRLTWLVDVAELARTLTGTDWDLAMERAIRTANERMLLLGLLLSRELLGAEIPDRLLVNIDADRAVRRIADQVLRSFDGSPQDMPEGVREQLTQVGLRRRPGEKLRYMAGVLTTPDQGDLDFLPLSKSTTRFYYAVRAVRLIAEPLRQLLPPTLGRWSRRMRTSLSARIASW